MELARTPEPPYYAVIFTSIKSARDEQYDRTSKEMISLAEAMPGFLGMESAREDIGITVSYWRSLDDIANWKNHAEHKVARKLGRDKWYTAFTVRICLVERAYSFVRQRPDDQDARLPMGKFLNKLSSALLVVDVQRGFDLMVDDGQRRNNPGAEKRIAALIEAARASDVPVIHIRHEGTTENSYFRLGKPGFEVKNEARERPGEAVLLKRVNSCFIGTNLEGKLRSSGVKTLIIVGATTNHCIETTARMAGNLGFDVRLVRDATWTYDRAGPDGDLHSADEIHAISLANLNGEFAEIVTADRIIESLSAK